MSDDASGEKRFSIVLCSIPEYEYLVAAIEFDGQEIALVSQEEGKEHLKLEASFGDTVKPGVAWIVELDSFLDAVARAKQRLLER